MHGAQGAPGLDRMRCGVGCGRAAEDTRKQIKAEEENRRNTHYCHNFAAALKTFFLYTQTQQLGSIICCYNIHFNKTGYIDIIPDTQE